MINISSVQNVRPDQELIEKGTSHVVDSLSLLYQKIRNGKCLVSSSYTVQYV